MKKLIFLAALSAFAQYPLTVTPYQAIYTANGVAIPCSNCFLYTYNAGTTTPLATYTTYTLGVALPNPIRTNSAGYAISGGNAITGVWTSATGCYHLVFKNAAAVTVFDQDHVCSPAGVAATLQAALAASSGSSLVGFIQSGTGAVAETVQSKLRQTINVLDFGAVCNGTTDDRVKIQAAVDATVSGTLIFPATACAVSSPGIFLYPANAGITLRASATVASIPGSTPQGGLISTASSPPTALLTIYAYNTSLDNIFLDGNSKASAYGLVAAGAGGGFGHWTNVRAYNFSSDGALITPASGSAATVASGGVSGTSTFVASATTTNRLLFNAFYCHGLVFDQGGSSQEFQSISSVVGTTVTISGTFANNQSGHTVSCNGNNNELQIIGFFGDSNGGYAIHETPQTDANGLLFDNPHTRSNALGGILVEGGSVDQIRGGEYEGDGGPAITVGSTANTSGPAFLTIPDPLLDLEEGSPSYTVSTSGTSVTGTGFVTGDKWVALRATINGVVYHVASVTNSTTMVLDSSAGIQASVSMSVDYNVIKMTCSNSAQISAVVETSIVFRASGGSCSSGGTGTATGNFIDGIGLGNWTKTQAGYTYNYNGVISWTPVGGTSSSITLLNPCVITAETGGDNAIVASCPAGSYTGTSFSNGFRVTFLNSTYAMRAGAPGNSLNLNGSGVKVVGACLTPGGYATNALTAGWSGDVIWNGTGNWCVMGAE